MEAGGHRGLPLQVAAAADPTGKVFLAILAQHHQGGLQHPQPWRWLPEEPGDRAKSPARLRLCSLPKAFRLASC